MVLAWIRLPGLPGYLYKRQIIEAIGSLIGKVVKLDLQTGNNTRGRFAHMAVFVNLDRPLISKVLVDGDVQRVEYESLPMVCFNCGKYGHVKELCLSVEVEAVLERSKAVLERTEADAVVAPGEVAGEGGDGKNVEFRPWMIVNRKSRRGSHAILGLTRLRKKERIRWDLDSRR